MVVGVLVIVIAVIKEKIKRNITNNFKATGRNRIFCVTMVDRIPEISYQINILLDFLKISIFHPFNAL